jgi:two-component system response regulator HydG
VSDIPLLANHFLKEYAKENGKAIDGIDDAALDLLIRYRWPGNVRALEGCEVLPLKQALEEPERRLIEHALRANEGNRQETAKALDINRTTLFNKMRKYDLLEKY